MNKILHDLDLDVHKESIAISIAPQNSTEVHCDGLIRWQRAARFW